MTRKITANNDKKLKMDIPTIFYHDNLSWYE